MNDLKEKFIVAISTREPRPSLIESVKSVRASKNVGHFRFLIVADFMPLEVRKDLEKYDVEIIETKQESTLPEKFKVILENVKTEIFILTQDDVRFEPDTLDQFLKAFESDREVTIASAHVGEIPGNNLFGRAVQTGPRIAYRIGRMWRAGDNYLMSSSRCMGWRTDFVRKFSIADGIINFDAYCYFENKRLGGKTRMIDSSLVLIRPPGKVKEYLNQSSRFQNSFIEMKQYFPAMKYEVEYKIPLNIGTRAALDEFASHPINTLVYFFLFAYARMRKIEVGKSLNQLWKEETSTK